MKNTVASLMGKLAVLSLKMLLSFIIYTELLLTKYEYRHSTAGM